MPRVLLFTLGISVVSGVLFGIAPALRATSTDLTSALKEKSSSRQEAPFQSGLSVGGGTGGRLANFAGRRRPVCPQSNQTSTGRSRFQSRQRIARERRHATGRLQSRRTECGLSSTLRSSERAAECSVRRPSPVTARCRAPAPTAPSPFAATLPAKDENTSVSDIQIGPNFAETLGVPLLMGRDIGLQDTPTSPKVAVVNQSFAQCLFSQRKSNRPPRYL